MPKTASQIETMRKGGSILYTILHTLGKSCIAGVTPKMLDQMAHELCKQYTVRPAFYGYMGFPGAVCTSVNSAVVHGIPNDIPLKNGDIIGVDFGVEWDGFCTDSAYTFVVGEIPKKTQKFLETVQKSLYSAIEIAKHGMRLGDISGTIGEIITKAGYSVVEELGGHGIGRAVHEEPHIYNFGKKGTGMFLEEGMTFAIEPIANIGKKHIYTAPDKWTIFSKDASLSGHFEHTIVVGKERGEILTIA